MYYRNLFLWLRIFETTHDMPLSHLAATPRSDRPVNLLAFLLPLLLSLFPASLSAASQPLTCTPSALKFAYVLVGKSETLTVTLANGGANSVTVSQVSAGGLEYSVSPLSLPLVLNPGQSLNLSVTFTPKTIGRRGANVAFTEVGSNTKFELPVEGTGTTREAAIASPSTLSFGAVAVGSTSTLPVVLTNMRPGELTLWGLQTSGSGYSVSGPSLPLKMAPGQSIGFVVTYAPRAAATDGGSVFVKGSGVAVPLIGTGTSTTTGQLVLTPTSLNFGNVAVGDTKKQPVTIGATGASVTISSVGSTSSRYVVQGASFPLTIPAGTSTSFDAAFTPQSSGTVSGTLSLSFTTGTGLNQATAHVTVTGSGSLGVGSAIPASFYGVTINKACSIADTKPDGRSCNNPEPHRLPGLPFTWARSLGAGYVKWADLVQCDPTGSVCPQPGSGCSKIGAGGNGSPCPGSELVPNCQPSSLAPDNPANCAYNWTVFDFWTKMFNANAVDWMYDAFYTPDYLSVRGSRCTGPGQAGFGPDATCVGPADICGGARGFKWGCDPPFDVDAAPGSGAADGSDQNLQWFVTAFMKHLQQNSEHIRYWEVWNEPNICEEWNHSDEIGVDCSLENPGGGPSTGTVGQLVRMAKDARKIIPTFDSSVQITSPPVVGLEAINNYMNKILSQGGQEFDLIGFHGYYAGSGGCPSNCPTPESWVSQWKAIVQVAGNAGQATKPAIDTEFSWGVTSNVTLPDMRAAQAARIYLLQESYYPALARVAWYGEDFPVEPNGGTGEFWASEATNVQDNCLTPDLVQGGFDCPAGLAMRQVYTWTVGATFDGPCSCSASPNGGNCAATPPTGVWQCAITQPNGHRGLLAWDNTATIFPCSNAACGTTTFPIPSGYNSDWQDLSGNVTPLAGASTVTIGAKPILIEN